MSDLSRLERVLEAYGAEPERWPADERAGLEALLAESRRARDLRDAAARLDALLDAAGDVPPPTSELSDRVLDHAPHEGAATRRWRWAALVPLAAAAAVLALYVARTPDPASLEPSAASTTESFEIAMADLGVYATPTDVLLSLDGVDPLAGVPAFDCEESDLGCLELDVEETERQTMQGESRRMRT